MERGPVLVLGASGLLGSNVVAATRDRNEAAVGTYYSREPALGDTMCVELDIRDADDVAALLDEHEPDHVVNCAALTDVDACERRFDDSCAVNADAPGAIAELCANRSVAFTHVSTDYVFDGEAETPYAEDDPTNPVQVYGEMKLAGERAVRDAHPDPTVVRLSFVYGVHRGRGELTGFPAWVRDRLQAGEPTPLFTDQRVTPTRAGQAAETLLALHDHGATGTYHVASRSCATPHAFGQRIRDRLGADPALVEVGSMADIDRPARRPAYTCLDVSRVEGVLDRAQPTLDADLDAIADAL